MSLPLIRRGDSTILRAVFDICRSLHLPNQPSQDCQAVLYERSTFNVQHRQLRNLRTPIPRQFGGAAIGPEHVTVWLGRLCCTVAVSRTACMVDCYARHLNNIRQGNDYFHNGEPPISFFRKLHLVFHGEVICYMWSSYVHWQDQPSQDPLRRHMAAQPVLPSS